MALHECSKDWRTSLVYHSAFKSVLHRCGWVCGWPDLGRSLTLSAYLFVKYVYTNLILLCVDTWNSSATVFTDLPDSRYPIKLNHAVSTNSVSHSKIKPVCKCDLLFPLCGKAVTHQWQIEHFCYFFFCTLHGREKWMWSLMCKMYLYVFLSGWKKI